MKKVPKEYHVRPLGEATNEFIQVLLDRFTLSRKGGQTVCEVAFDNETPCIWTRAGKAYVRQNIPRFHARRNRYMKELAAFLAEPSGEYRFEDAGFPFRFVSGGALPVVRMGGTEYFALVYREIFPVGWNLANGGSDSPAELLNPFAVAERELREELIVLNPKRGCRYIFKEEECAEEPLDMPEYLIARRLWREQLLRKGWGDIGRFMPERLPMKWLDGPDTLKIRGNNKDFTEQPDCYLNIRAEDFGIEVDRIAKLDLGVQTDDVILLDGELVGGQLVGAPVGLFEVRRMAELTGAGTREFLPDFFFYDGKRHNGGRADLRKVLVQKFIPRICELMPQWKHKEWLDEAHPFDLCPVARGVLERAAKLWQPVEKSTAGGCDVFISFAAPDKGLAAEVNDHLARRMGVKVYFSEESREADYTGAIYNALDSAKCLVAVGTSRENLCRNWPRYEHGAFHGRMLAGSTPASAMVSYISRMLPHELPQPLATYNSVVKELEGKRALERLGRFVATVL